MLFRSGFCAILKGLKKYDLTLIINGGDTFVSRCIEENTASSLFDGVNQETVFTRIDFTSKTYSQQAEAETTYFQEYLSGRTLHGSGAARPDRQVSAGCGHSQAKVKRGRTP